MIKSDKLVVSGSWVVKADRDKVYAVISDFERMPERFPRIARSMRILRRDGNRLTIEAEAASFGRIFPQVRVAMVAELLPGEGYRCSTHNLTFNTNGEEQLLLVDDPGGTRIEYTYIIAVRNRWMKPIYAWLTRTFGMPYWKRAFVDRLVPLVTERFGI
jgi:hypothetical protein